MINALKVINIVCLPDKVTLILEMSVDEHTSQLIPVDLSRELLKQLFEEMEKDVYD